MYIKKVDIPVVLLVPCAVAVSYCSSVSTLSYSCKDTCFFFGCCVRPRSIRKLLRNWLISFADLRGVCAIIHLPHYFADWWRFSKLAGPGSLNWRDSYPNLTDRTTNTPFDPHYFYQAYWLAYKLTVAPPCKHVDIGSSVMVIATISAIVPTLFVDYRPLIVQLPGLTSMGADLLALPFANDSLGSMSCLHVIEHVGLGRYGDLLDPLGSIKASQELKRVLAPGGRLLVSAPVGRERVQFNAHRIFAPETLLSMFEGLELMDFALVDDKGFFYTNSSPFQATRCEYSCGMFEFIKKAT